MKKLFTNITPYFFLLIISFLPIYLFAQDQDTLIIVEYPAENKIELTVIGSSEVQNGLLKFTYYVKSQPSSLQDVWNFRIEAFSAVHEIDEPNQWASSKIASEIYGFPMVSWWGRDSLLFISPGNELNDFSFYTDGLPSIVNFYGRGWVDPPTFDVEPDSILGGRFPENSVKGKTIGPKATPQNITNTELANTHSSYLTQSCDLGWIENRGICRSLQAKLDNVKRQLKQGRTQTAANNLQAFLNEVEAIREQQLSPEAYALLKYNGEYLLKKLREE